MDNKQTQDSMVMTMSIAGGIGFVAFVALMVIGGFGFSAALFLALVIAVAVFFFLLFGFHRKADAGPVGPGGGAAGGPGGGSGASAGGPGPVAAAAAASGGGAAVADEVASAGTSGGKGGTFDAKGGKSDAKGGKSDSKGGKADVGGTHGVNPTKPAPAGEDYDKDGVAEGADEGTKPATLDGPRGGEADNLKEIKGVGPKMEKMLNGMGFYHFDQVAGWTADEVAWVNANLEGFKGRVTRDDWVEQAKILASGGDTEFSKRVDKGGVY